MSNDTLDTNTATDAAQTNQATETKTYTQEEFDRHMSGLKQSLTKKLTKQYEDLGDVEELRKLKTQAEQAKSEQALKRGEFDKVMQDLASKKDAEISKRDMIIKDYRVNTPLLSAAAQYQAVNAEQVKALLSSNVRLNEDGDVEVVDSKGAVRYNEKGAPLGVNELVREFLDSNPHFKLPTPATTNTKSSYVANGSNVVDINSLDMKNPAHRKIYAEAKAKAKK